MSYVTLEQVKATLNLQTEDYADADISAAIVAASKGVDNLCKRKGTTTRDGFGQDADANQVRYYTPVELYRQDIDDLVTLTSLLTDPAGDNSWPDTWTLDTDFSLEPLNAATEGWPFTRLAVRPSGSFVFPTGYVRSVKLTGQFGWPTIPDAIVEATTILSSRLLKRAREVPFGVVGVNLDGAVARIAKSDPDVMFLVGPYIKHRISVA